MSLARNAFRTVTVNRHPSVYMPTVLSLAAVYGEIKFAHTHDPRYLEDPRLKAFQERARIFIVPRPGPATRGQRMEMSITVRTRDGKTLREDLRFPVMSEQEIRQKFHDLAGLRLNNEQVADLERQLKAIETETNVAPLIRSLEVAY